MASSYLAEFPGGPIDGFIERYINLEEEIHKAKLASGATDATSRAEDADLSGADQQDERPPPESSSPKDSLPNVDPSPV